MATAEPTMEPGSDARAGVRDLILVLADSKRLLGMRYAEWILGAPELEAGIACASMAQDEWGHARLLYAMLKEFGDDVDALEHGREPGAYRNIEALDRPADGWPAFVALNAVVDAALSAQLAALVDSSYAPLAGRVQKMLDEERFHAAHGAAWLRRLARGGDEPRAAMAGALKAVLPTVLAWFGPDDARAATLREAGVADATGSALRERFARRIAPLLAEAGVEPGAQPDFDGFDAATRRRSHEGPDAETIARVRGDKNRAFLMD